MEPRRLIIDTDPGLDDTAAILFVLAWPDRVRIDFLTTVFGNVEVAQTTRNALAILDVAGRPDIPVYRGAAVPLLRPPNFARHIHGDDGLGGLASQYLPTRGADPGLAAERIVEHAMAAPGEDHAGGTGAAHQRRAGPATRAASRRGGPPDRANGRRRPSTR